MIGLWCIICSADFTIRGWQPSCTLNFIRDGHKRFSDTPKISFILLPCGTSTADLLPWAPSNPGNLQSTLDLLEEDETLHTSKSNCRWYILQQACHCTAPAQTTTYGNNKQSWPTKRMHWNSWWPTSCSHKKPSRNMCRSTCSCSQVLQEYLLIEQQL